MPEKSYKLHLTRALAGLLVVASLFGLSVPAFALAGLNSFNATPINEATPITALDSSQLQLCTARSSDINDILTRIANRGSKHLALITDVANKTESYYTKSGKSLSNYDALLGTLNTDKTAATSSVELVRSLSTSFSCSGSDPLGILQQFKDDTTGEVAALQTYKAAVQNLITGVKSVTSTGGN